MTGVVVSAQFTIGGPQLDGGFTASVRSSGGSPAADGSVLQLTGDITNRGELSRHLGLPAGATSQTLLRAAVAEDRLDVLGGLRGPFAFAHWSPRRQRLLAMTDQFGLRSLTAMEDENGSVTVGTQLAEFEPHEVVVDPIGLSAYLQSGRPDLVPGPRARARPLEAGVLHEWARTGSGAFTRSASRIARRADYQFSGLSPALADSLAVHWRAGDRAGVLFSGGPASGLLASHCLTRDPDTQLVTWTIESPLSERRTHAASALARHLTARHHIVRLTATDLIEAAESLVLRTRLPGGNPGALALQAAAARAAGLSDVLLSGEGARGRRLARRRPIRSPAGRRAVDTFRAPASGPWVDARLVLEADELVSERRHRSGIPSWVPRAGDLNVSTLPPDMGVQAPFLDAVVLARRGCPLTASAADRELRELFARPTAERSADRDGDDSMLMELVTGILVEDFRREAHGTQSVLRQALGRAAQNGIGRCAATSPHLRYRIAQVGLWDRLGRGGK